MTGDRGRPLARLGLSPTRSARASGWWWLALENPSGCAWCSVLVWGRRAWERSKTKEGEAREGAECEREGEQGRGTTQHHHTLARFDHHLNPFSLERESSLINLDTSFGHFDDLVTRRYHLPSWTVRLPLS